GVKGSAALADSIRKAERAYEQAEANLNAAVEAFTGLDDVAAARENLAGLREALDQARDHLAELQAASAPAVTVSADDWHLLTLEEQRGLIRAVIDRAL